MRQLGPPSLKFDYGQDFSAIDFRECPELYRVGVGEQGVLLIQPYKSELLPLWRFKDPDIARTSADALTKAFYKYVDEGDFAGMDMARKFLQMGYTRSRRYANHRSGKKYDGPVPTELKGRSGSHGRAILPQTVDPIKAECAQVFKKAWDYVEKCETYREIKREWKLWYG